MFNLEILLDRFEEDLYIEAMVDAVKVKLLVRN
jgi:hypothetical protein